MFTARDSEWVVTYGYPYPETSADDEHDASIATLGTTGGLVADPYTRDDQPAAVPAMGIIWRSDR